MELHSVCRAVRQSPLLARRGGIHGEDYRGRDSMPSIYTHQRFGNEVEQLLPEGIRKITDAHRDLFSIGFQGPDIFFFYHPLSWGEVPQYGNRMHELPGHEFFGRALEQYRRLPEESTAQKEFKRGAAAYLFGVLCHYALDSTCHKFIDEVDASGVTTHAALEGDYDRRLIEREGRDPVKEDVVREFRPSRQGAEAIAVFYPEMDAGIVEKAMKSCVRLQHLLYCPGDGKRNFLYGALRLLGKYESLHPHIMNKNPDPACQEAEERLDALYQEAIPLAVQLITDMQRSMEAIRTEHASEDVRRFVEGNEYDRNFGGIIVGAVPEQKERE